VNITSGIHKPHHNKGVHYKGEIRLRGKKVFDSDWVKDLL
jgi:hypothetical protein